MTSELKREYLDLVENHLEKERAIGRLDDHPKITLPHPSGRRRMEDIWAKLPIGKKTGGQVLKSPEELKKPQKREPVKREPQLLYKKQVPVVKNNQPNVEMEEALLVDGAF